MWLMCCLLGLATHADGTEVGAADFGRLMEGLHGDVRDVSFVYEGMSRGLRLGLSIEEDVKLGVDHRYGEGIYQGGYSFRRSDGGTRVDCYADYSGDGKAHKSFSNRRLEVLFENKLHSLCQLPDLRDEKPTVKGGIAGSLNQPCSPERILYSWFFSPLLKDPAKMGYRFLGWEDVDGHRCLKIQLDETWGLSDDWADRPVVRFWIDMERGGHPIQVEFRRGEKFWMRIVKIKLEKVSGGDSRERWFPVGGVVEVYPFFDEDYKGEVVAYETYEVVKGTVRFNQDLPDAFFSLDWKGAIPENEQLATRRKEFRKPPRRYDPEGIKERLVETLADADAQSKQLEASSPAREPWNWVLLGQGGLAAVGTLILLGVGVRKWTGA